MSMKHIFIVLFISILGLTSGVVVAKTPASQFGQLNWVDVKQAELSEAMLTPANGGNAGLLAQVGSDTVGTQAAPFPIIKSPRKALLFSAIIPGAGELYAKAYLPAIAFFALETTLWLMYNKYTKKGQELEDEFEAFADEHWRLDVYEAWLYNSDESITEGLDKEENRTHTLPRDDNDSVVRTQQYYEMIGKYDQFYAGWDDSGWFIGGPSGISKEGGYTYGTTRSPIRLEYMDRREDSNIQLKNATTMASIAILNHIVSAVDGAWSAYRYNKNYAKKQQTSIRFDTIQYAQHVYPAISFNMRW
jgi:hypothetical protein